MNPQNTRDFQYMYSNMQTMLAAKFLTSAGKPLLMYNNGD